MVVVRFSLEITLTRFFTLVTGSRNRAADIELSGQTIGLMAGGYEPHLSRSEYTKVELGVSELT